MRKSCFKVCAQLVYNLSTIPLGQVGLRTVPTAGSNGPVDLSGTYTSSKPVFVLGLVHRFFTQLTEVTDRLMPTIHMTNKDKYKYKLRITT
jgi:hypothetical protein